jgi:hypothetical protein
MRETLLLGVVAFVASFATAGLRTRHAARTEPCSDQKTATASFSQPRRVENGRLLAWAQKFAAMASTYREQASAQPLPLPKLSDLDLATADPESDVQDRARRLRSAIYERIAPLNVIAHRCLPPGFLGHTYLDLRLQLESDRRSAEATKVESLEVVEGAALSSEAQACISAIYEKAVPLAVQPKRKGLEFFPLNGTARFRIEMKRVQAPAETAVK